MKSTAAWVAAGAWGLIDHAYYWPHFTPITQAVRYGPKDVALFTLSKLTGAPTPFAQPAPCLSHRNSYSKPLPGMGTWYCLGLSSRDQEDAAWHASAVLHSLLPVLAGAQATQARVWGGP